MGFEIVNKGLDLIPKIISGIRDFIIKIFDVLHLPSNTYTFGIMILALFLSYYWIKQWITYSVFTKISTILNWLLLGLLIYVLFAYV